MSESDILVPASEKKPFVSVVMTLFNMERTIRECLESLLNVDYPKENYEIVIVDGGSTDTTREVIEEYANKDEHPEIRLSVKKGYIGTGRNEGVKHAKGEFIAITDGDMVVSREWIGELLAGFEDEKIVGVGGPNNSAEGTLFTKTISCLDIHGPCNDVVPLFGSNRYSQPFKSNTDIYTTVCRNSCYRRSIFEELGGFDESLVATEDPEWNQRILNAGHWLAFNPKAIVQHHHRSSAKSFFKQQRNYAVGQAIVNKSHPEMFKPVQMLPLAGSIFMLALLILSVLLPLLFYLFFVIVVLYLLLYLYYGLKCAIKKKDMRIVPTMLFAVLLWHSAWILGYVKGLASRKKVEKGMDYGIKSHSE
jgi:cellulose synthase/poly-beta-1,6-N-acetylglucosamine synthase-like glycosyltransferase